MKQHLVHTKDGTVETFTGDPAKLDPIENSLVIDTEDGRHIRWYWPNVISHTESEHDDD